MSRGIVMFAHNNQEIDYGKIALVNALMIKKNLAVDVALITDHGTHSWLTQSIGHKLISEAFAHIIVPTTDPNYVNNRLYRDTTYTCKELPFYNKNRWEAYSLTPFDETIVLDSDYLVMSNSLNKVWGCSYDFLMNNRITEVLTDRDQAEKYISGFGISSWWATVLYFKKCEYSKCMFDLVSYIQDNYTYYRHLYGIQGHMFRNDYAFSIAQHIMSGFSNSHSPQLPVSTLLKSFDCDDFYSVNGLNDLTLYVEKPGFSGQFYLANVVNQDIHIMNKWSILRMADELIEVYK